MERVYRTLEPSVNREAWLAQRMQMLTASDVAAAIDRHKYKTSQEVIDEKTGAVPPWNPADEFKVVPHEGGFSYRNPLEAGLLFEQPVAEWFSRVSGHRVRPAGRLMVSTLTPWLGATPDFWIKEKGQRGLGIVETKMVSSFARKAWMEGGPNYYRIQLQTQLYVSGCKYGWLVGVVGGHEIVAWRYKFNAEKWDIILDKLTRVWEHIQTVKGSR